MDASEKNEKKLFSEEAELAVLGGLMIDATKLTEIRASLTIDDFVDLKHRLVWKAILSVQDNGLAVDLVTVMEQMEQDGTLPHPVEMAYVVMLAKETPSASNVESYAKLVKGYAVRRKLFGLSESLSQWVYDDKNALEIPGKIREYLEQLDSSIPTSGGPQLVGNVMMNALMILDERSQKPPGLTGLSTGLLDLDQALDGLQAGRMYIVAARPAMGKSILSMQFAREAVKQDRAAAFFSLEMPADELANRLWAADQRIPYGKIQSAQLQPAEWTALCDMTTAMANTLLWIDESEDLTAEEIAARARRLHRKQPLSLLVVDYIGLIREGAKTTNRNREQEVASMSRSFKKLAKELRIPVVIVAQLNRELERRSDKRPILSDLRESGSLEQDADCVMMLYRDEVYNPDTTDKGCAEILIRKNRAGQVGIIPTQFEGQFCRFNDLAGGLPSSQGQSAQSTGSSFP